MIVSTSDVIVSISHNHVYLNSISVSDFEIKKWHHIALIMNERNATLYIDGCNSQSDKCSKASSIIFGSQSVNRALWFIGGTISIVNDNLSQKQIRQFSSKGIQFIRPVFSQKFKTISPRRYILSTFHSELGLNTRPVVSFPLSNYFITLFHGGQGIFDHLLEILPTLSHEEGKLFIEAFCSLHKSNILRFTNTNFAYSMSTLFLIMPHLFDDKVSQLFVETIFLNPDSFLVFFFRFFIHIKSFFLESTCSSFFRSTSNESVFYRLILSSSFYNLSSS